MALFLFLSIVLIVALVYVLPPFFALIALFLLGCTIVFQWQRIRQLIHARQYKKLSTHYTHFRAIHTPQFSFHHIVVSPYGLFVVHYVQARKKIYGEQHEPVWVAKQRGDYESFQNPIMAQQQHIAALQQYCGIDVQPHALLVFPNDVKFQQEEPVTAARLLKQKQVVAHIEQHTLQQLSHVTVQQIEQRLQRLQQPRRWYERLRTKRVSLELTAVQEPQQVVQAAVATPAAERNIVVKRVFPQAQQFNDWSL